MRVEPAPNTDRNHASHAVALVGMGLTVPGATSPEQFWNLLQEGTELLADPPPQRWRTDDFVSSDRSAPDKTYQQAGGFVTGTLPGRDDYAQVWLRHCVDQAMAEVRRTDGDRYSLCLGYTADGSQHQEEALLAAGLLAGADGLDEADTGQLRSMMRRHFPRAGEPGRYLPHRIARDAVHRILPADTRVHLIDTACSSSLYAVDLGVREILAGDVDIAVCGGALVLTPTMSVLFAKNGGLSPTGRVRSFDADADGVLFSDGAAVVVLKRLDRALADGDTVHGVVVGSGLSADGKGTSIYKPAVAGQKLAITRALENSGVSPEEVGLIVAHATGTPAGDLAELTGLRECYPGRGTVPVVSNKSLIGHTGWAAGVVSVIHLMLALRHQVIPAQHRFRAASEAAGLNGSRLAVPGAAVAWSSDGRPRIGAVSGFGFGGTNAHLLVREHGPHLPAASPYRRREHDDLVVVGWAARLPDGATGFGDEYPPPGRDELRLPPPAVRRLDRTQLMLVQCVHRLAPAVRAALSRRGERTGVVVGHAGPTRSALLYRLRAHLDEVERVAAEAGAGPGVKEYLGAFRDRVTGLIPPPTEDSSPGEMPNVIAGRLANCFDLRGLNATVDQGGASLLEAFELACRYLEFGDLEIALVGGVSGNSLAEWQAATLGPEPLREGAYLFAVTTRGVAAEEGLPVLAAIRDVGVADEPAARSAGGLQGAEGGDELVAFLLGQAPEARISRRPGPGERAHVLSLRREDGAAPAAGAASRHGGTAEEATAAVTRMDRHVLTLAPHPRRPVRPARRVVPAAAVLLTNNAATTGLDGNSATVVEVGHDGAVARRDGSVRQVELTEDAFDDLLAGSDPAQLQIVCDLSRVAAGFDPAGPEHRAVLRLHDAMFLAARAAAARWTTGHSFTVLVLGGIRSDRTPHPLSGLFTGFVRVLAQEFGPSAVYAVVHEAPDFASAAEDLRAEADAERLLPDVYYAGGERLLVRAERRSARPGPAALTRSSVVVAAGGARGIGAEVLKSLARDAAPRLFVLGSTAVDGLDLAAVEAGKAEFIRSRTTGPHALTVPQADRAFERLVRAREVRDTLDELTEHCGEGRVSYLACDLRDADEVRRAIEQVLHAEPRVDLLLNVAGIISTALVGNKSLADFTAVRDLKLLAHTNLANAFGDQLPLTWCNFGSANSFLGQPGDTDYAAGNEFLHSAAQYAAACGHDQYTVGFGLWGEAGFASGPLWRSYLDTSGELTPMNSQEGVRHFLAELAEPDRPVGTVQLGDRERAVLERTAPGYLPWCDRTTGAPSRASARSGSAYHVEESTAQSVTLLRTFDLERDGYLTHHLVRGLPTLPGSFYPELAAEAAVRLLPGMVPVAFDNLVLAAFLRVPGPDRPQTVRVSARLHAREGADSVVRVRITGDVVAPGGRVLVRDKLHGSVEVRLGDAARPAPRWPEPAEARVGEAVHPLYGNAPGIRLSGMFRPVAEPSVQPDGRRGRLRLDPAARHRWFPNALTPELVLEALVQLAVIQAPGEPAEIRVPRSIRRIELFDAPTERGDLRLYGSAHDLSDLDSGAPRNEGVAVTADGLVLARVSGIATVTLGRPAP
ncbi:SDR family NAD(P)-dependent oxidoreductase [Kitasatospora sp. NPDC001175]|uniref:SDR family NAD(P)-dependent oxidoreductase n=1 Tax=Kitasatospora sp. NPDC001175 TaxID=3157103 RepID=UPI003CFDFB33